MATFLLQHPLQNHRGHDESFAAYRRRRKNGKAAVDRHLKGKLAHTSTEIVGPLPPLGVDAQVDKAILDGQLRDAALVTTPPGLPWPFGPRKPAAKPGQYRMARTKGITYQHPTKEQFPAWKRKARRAFALTDWLKPKC